MEMQVLLYLKFHKVIMATARILMPMACPWGRVNQRVWP